MDHLLEDGKKFLTVVVILSLGIGLAEGNFFGILLCWGIVYGVARCLRDTKEEAEEARERAEEAAEASSSEEVARRERKRRVRELG